MDDSHEEHERTQRNHSETNKSEIGLSLLGTLIGCLISIPFVAALFLLFPAVEQASIAGFLRMLVGFTLVLSFCKFGKRLTVARLRENHVD